MDIKFYIQALEQIKTQNAQVQLAICQVLGALNGEQFKQDEPLRVALCTLGVELLYQIYA